MQPIRTASELEAHIKIYPTKDIPKYEKHAQKVAELRLLGMTFKQIAQSLGITERVTENAYRYYKSSNSVAPESGKTPTSVIPEFPEGKYPGSNKNKKRRK